MAGRIGGARRAYSNAMKSKERTVTPDSRHDFSWTADCDDGFEQSTFIYDGEGRLIAIDYSSRRATSREDSPDSREHEH